jgi:hypothetical protein
MRFGVPSTSARTRCMLGFLVRFVAMWEWLTVLPWTDFFSQISHLYAIYHTSRNGAFLQSKCYSTIEAGLWQAFFVIFGNSRAFVTAG